MEEGIEVTQVLNFLIYMYVKREVTENSLLNFRPITTMKSKTSNAIHNFKQN